MNRRFQTKVNNPGIQYKQNAVLTEELSEKLRFLQTVLYDAFQMMKGKMRDSAILLTKENFVMARNDSGEELIKNILALNQTRKLPNYLNK